MTGFTQEKFGRLISRVLLGGVALCAALLLAGLTLSAAGAPAGAALVKAGLLALIITPAARVVMLIYGYWRGGERYFALASAAVLALLAVSAFV